MLKQKLKFKNSKYILTALFLIAGVISTTVYNGLAQADQFDEKIRILQKRNANYQNKADQLADRASNYQDAVNRLRAQISDLQGKIDKNQQKSRSLQKQIDKAQKELDYQKEVLGANIKAMYLEGQISTLEVLAASHDLSDFVDKEQNRTAVQSKVQDTLENITKLKLDLQRKHSLLKETIKDQETQQAQLNENRAAQAHLLNLTEAEKASFDQRMKKTNERIAEQRAMQLAANQSLGGSATAGDPNHGGYPSYLDRARQDSLVDPWGMLNRECVSYTAWKVYQTFGHMPYWGGVGNANQWPADARAAGISTSSKPKVHSVAISMAGGFGHAMWVEGVSGNYIHVSQYNYDLAGHYSEMTINGSGLIYIYFK